MNEIKPSSGYISNDNFYEERKDLAAALGGLREVICMKL
jgi:hypothetical protein